MPLAKVLLMTKETDALKPLLGHLELVKISHYAGCKRRINSTVPVYACATTVRGEVMMSGALGASGGVLGDWKDSALEIPPRIHVVRHRQAPVLLQQSPEDN